MTDRRRLSWEAIDRTLDHYHWIAALLIVGLGLGLRAGGLGEFWPNADEGIYLSAASGDWSRLQDLIFSNAHPPLFYLVLFGMSAVSSEYIWLRAASLICGCIAIYGAHLLGRRMAGWPGGLTAAVMMACSPAAITLSQVIRPYSMLLASTTFCLWYLFREMQEPARRQRVAYAILICLSLLLHYSAIILLAGIGGCILVAWACGELNRSSARRLLIMQVPAACIAITLVITHVLPELMGSELQSLARDDGWLAGFYPGSFAEVWENLLGIFVYCFGLNMAAPVVLLSLGGLLLGMKQLRAARNGLFAGCLLAGITLAIIGLYPFGPTRHSIYLIPVLMLPVAGLFGELFARSLRQNWHIDLIVLLILILPGFSTWLLVFGTDAAYVSAKNEQRLSRETVDVAMGILQDQPEGDRILLMDQRCFFTLAPLLEKAAGSLTQSTTSNGFSQFSWQGWTVIVSKSWIITASRENREREDHLLELVKDVTEKSPEIALAECERLVIVADGRIPRVVGDFLGFLSEGEEGVALFLESHNLGTFHVFAIDMRRYLNLMN